ncbi:MAG: PAS domain S-box protein [Acidobacteriia bacterium]|nr:PAS domain S-box protein [Terriglobia bacterium]
MKFSMQARAAAGLALAGAVILGLALFSYHNIRAAADDNRVVWRSHDLLQEIAATRSAIAEAETSSRGFVLTGDNSYLDLYNSARLRLPQHLDRLRLLVADNPRQRQRLASLEFHLAARLDLLQQALDLHRRAGFAASRDFVQTGGGAAEMRQFFQTAAEMQQAAEDLHHSREQTFALLSRRTLALIAAVVAALLFLLGAVYYMLARDIQDRRRAAAALRESEERYALAVGGSNDGLWDWHIPTNENFLSPRFKQILGFQDSELPNVYESWASRIHPDDRNSVHSALQAHLQGSLPAFEVEHRLLHKNGSYRWVLARGISRRDAAGRPCRMAGSLTDISARKFGEEIVSQANSFLDSIVENIPNMVFLKDAQDLRFVRVNKAAEELLGFARTELLGRNVYDLFPKPEADFFTSKDREVFSSGRLVDIAEEALHTKRQGVRILHTRKISIRDASGSPAFLLGLSEDITERKQMEQALRQSEERFRNLAEVSPVGFFYTDAQGQSLYVNHRWCEITGLSSKQARNGEWTQALHPGDRELVVSGLARAIRQGSRFHSEHRYLNPSFGVVWVIAQAAPVVTHDGKITGYVGSLTDITERKKMEDEVRRYQEELEQRVRERTTQFSQANAILREKMQEHLRMLEELRESQQRLSLYVRQSPMAAIEWNHALQVTEWNLAAEKVFGYSRAEALGRELNFIFPESAREHLREIAGGLLARCGGARGTQENITKDGKIILCEWYSSPLVDAAGQVVGIASQANDITELRKLEEQYRQAQKMEAVGQLAGGIAHDFNNLLSAILGYSDLVMEAMAPGDPQRKKIEHIEKAGRRAASLIQQLLAFSRKQVLALRVLDLNGFLQDMDHLLQHLIGENIELRRHADPSLGQVRVDPGQMEQVVMNLAVNARDAMPHGGILTLEAANVTLDEEYCRKHVTGEPGEYVMLAISDTGTGIDEATRQRIFEPFFTTKEPGKGTGLGLSTVYGIVKQSGGHIEVYSEVGKGTSFKIYLPRVNEKPQALPAATPQQGEMRGTETVLVVEDDEELRTMAREYLAAQGYTLLVASNSAEALPIVESHPGPIAIVITDVVMPGLSGPQLVQKLTELRPGIKALYVSGYTQDAIVHHGVLDPGIEFLAKPYRPSDLARKVRGILDKAAPQRKENAPRALEGKPQ